MAKATKRVADIKVGDRISWKAAGKVARLEGMAGKIATGTVTEILKDQGVVVLPDHRTVEGANFKNMQAKVLFAKVL